MSELAPLISTLVNDPSFTGSVVDWLSLARTFQTDSKHKVIKTGYIFRYEFNDAGNHPFSVILFSPFSTIVGRNVPLFIVMNKQNEAGLQSGVMMLILILALIFCVRLVCPMSVWAFLLPTRSTAAGSFTQFRVS